MSIASHLKRFSYRTRALSTATAASEGAALGYELSAIPLAGGGTLRGFVRAPRGDNARFLLFFPGNAKGQLAEALALLELLRDARDLGVAVWSYRGFEGSDGEPSPEASAEDARMQRAFLSARYGVPCERLVIAGYSMGSGIALRLCAELAVREQAPSGLMLLSPFSRFSPSPPHWYGRLLRAHRYETSDWAARYRGPTLVMAGSNDDVLPVAVHARPLVRTLGAQARYIELPGKGHVDYLHDRSLLVPAIDFIQSC